MDLANKLELLLDITECGSFAKAADRRNMDRSALSKQIKNLEEELGVRLLNRSTRALSLTNAGAAIVKQANSVRELLEETRSMADSLQSEPSGHLKISSPTLFGRMYLQQAVDNFLDKYPRVSVEMVLDDRKVDIIGDRFDIVFRFGPLNDSNLVARKLATNRHLIVASEAFIARHGIPATPAELANLPAVIYSNGPLTFNKLQISPSPDSNEIRSYPTKGRFTVNDADLILRAVMADKGFAEIGQFMLPRPLSEMGMVALLPEHRLSDFGNVSALYSHRNQPPIVKAFIDTVQALIGTPPKWEQYAIS